MAFVKSLLHRPVHGLDRGIDVVLFGDVGIAPYGRTTAASVPVTRALTLAQVLVSNLHA